VIFMQQLVGPKADAALLEPGGAVPTALAEIATFLFGGEGVPSTLMRCRVVGQREEFAQVESLLGEWVAQQVAGGVEASADDFSKVADFVPSSSKTFFAVPSQTNYVAQSFRTVPYAHADAAPLLLLGQVLSTCYLHREIREKGGAYGGGATASAVGGLFSFSSYRDPRTLETLDTFAEAIAWAVKGEFTQRDLDEAKLRAFKSLDAPTPPSGKGAAFFLNRMEDEERQEFRDRVLAVEMADLPRVARQYLAETEGPVASCIVGNQEKVTVKHGEDGWSVLDANMQPFSPSK